MRIRDLLVNGDMAAASRALLSRWRARPHPAIAEALEVVSRRISRDPIVGADAAEREVQWRTIAAQGDAADTPRLLAVLLDGTSEVVAGRVAMLAERGRDPRVAALLVKCLVDRTFVTRYPFRRAVYDALEAMADPRQQGPLRALVPHGHVVTQGHFHEWDLPARRLPPLLRMLENISVPDLDDEEVAALEEIRALAAAPAVNDEALLAEIYEHPDDDAPRLVYGDALARRGDPRGELIALQLARGRTGKASAREKELVRSLRGELLGPLKGAVSDPVFARGFLAACRVRWIQRGSSLLADPRWSTVESLTTFDPDIIRRANLRALRCIEVTNRDGLAALLAGEPLPRIHTLVLDMDHPLSDASAASEALPGLRTLRIKVVLRREPTEVFGNVLAGRLGANLEEIVVEGYESKLEVARWGALCPRAKVRFELTNFRAELDAGSLRVALRGNAEDAYRELLDSVDADAHGCIAIIAPRKFVPPAP